MIISTPSENEVLILMDTPESAREVAQWLRSAITLFHPTLIPDPSPMTNAPSSKQIELDDSKLAKLEQQRAQRARENRESVQQRIRNQSGAGLPFRVQPNPK